MNLDIRTVIQLFVVGNLLIAALIVLGFRGRRSRFIHLWIAGLLVQAVGWPLLALQDVLPHRFGLVAGATLLSLGYALLTAVAMEFYESRRWLAWAFLPVVLAFAAMVLIDAPASRGAAGSLVFALQLALAAGFLLSRGDRWIGLRLAISGSALLAAATMAMRGAMLLDEPGMMPLVPDSSRFQSMVFLVGYIARYTYLFGFLLLIEAHHLEDIRRLATLDPLTEAYNRRTFIELAEHEMKRGQRSGRPVSLMVLDVDHFKAVNDAHGHLAGDAALKRITAVAVRALRGQDVFGRFGGEEFCVLAPETDAAGAMILAERLRHAIAEKAEGAVPTTVSIGVATLHPVTREDSLDGLIARADRALYRAKAAGRNRAEAALPPDAEMAADMA